MSKDRFKEEFQRYTQSVAKWSSDKSKDNLKEMTLAFVMYYSRFNKEKTLKGFSRKELVTRLETIRAMERIIGELTIGDFMDILPPKKVYQGNINYNTTMRHIEGNGGTDALLSDCGVKSLMFGFYNTDVFFYVISRALLERVVKDQDSSIEDTFIEEMNRVARSRKV